MFFIKIYIKESYMNYYDTSISDVWSVLHTCSRIGKELHVFL